MATEPALRVVYVLILWLDHERTIRVGRLGHIDFPRGIYFYVGSGGRSPAKRIARHIRKKKRKFWHIDFLTAHAAVIGAFLLDAGDISECTMASNLAGKFRPVAGFGSSDCRCGSHLFFAGIGE
jgi:sugar fermentation stimulation protein A